MWQRCGGGVPESCCAQRQRNGVFAASGVKGVGVDLGFGCRWKAMGSRGLCHVGIGQSIVGIAIWRVLCAKCVAMRSRG